MGESLTEQCRVEVEGPRVVNFFSRRRSNDAAVRQRMQALSGMIGRKASVGGFSSPPSNPRAQPWTGGGNYQAGVRYPSSPSRKRWILGAVRIDPCSAVANALSIPPGEYVRKNETQKELTGARTSGGACGVGLSPATSATLVFSCHHWVWNPEQTAGDKPEEGEDDVKSSCPLCPGRHTCYNGRDKGSRSREGELTQNPSSVRIAGCNSPA
ncbi:hypothetical protein H6P81_021534 [Aristolochia fimbriata]|uniref:Uncharacterized protein n=1 Tax=Aristolochia fimbriata TaxID=158543 RepID=A0AAV7DRC6_ARIFI|nr:hypothetical protein H6P81_021534 [Aristolochia fimbriata]